MKIGKDLESSGLESIELSQLSKWTDDNNAPAIKKSKKKLLSRDQEALIEEIMDLKSNQNIYQEEIKLLKAEIVKLKKRGPS